MLYVRTSLALAIWMCVAANQFVGCAYKYKNAEPGDPSDPVEAGGILKANEKLVLNKYEVYTDTWGGANYVIEVQNGASPILS